MAPEIWDLYERETGRFVRRMVKGEGFVPDNLYHEAVEVIATNKQGYILMTLGENALYEFPAGSVLSGEDPRQTAKRKLLEATGLKPRTTSRLSDGLAPGVKRYVYLAYIPDLTDQVAGIQKNGSRDLRLTTVDGWLDMLIDGTFDPKRSCGYNKRFLDHLREAVGNDPGMSQPAAESIGQLKPVSIEELTARHKSRNVAEESDEDSQENTEYLDPITGVLEFKDGFSKIRYTAKEREGGIFL